MKKLALGAAAALICAVPVVGGAPASVFSGHAFYDPEGEKLRA